MQPQILQTLSACLVAVIIPTGKEGKTKEVVKDRKVCERWYVRKKDGVCEKMVRIYVCMHVCMYVCMYARMHVCMYGPQARFFPPRAEAAACA